MPKRKNESNKHKELKEKIIQKYNSLDVMIIEEFKFKNYIFDVVLIDKKTNKIIKIIECLSSETLIHALNKFKSLEIDVNKEIVREFKKKNYKAKKIIEQIKLNNIIFTEFKLEKTEYERY